MCYSWQSERIPEINELCVNFWDPLGLGSILVYLRISFPIIIILFNYNEASG